MTHLAVKEYNGAGEFLGVYVLEDNSRPPVAAFTEEWLQIDAEEWLSTITPWDQGWGAVMAWMVESANHITVQRTGPVETKLSAEQYLAESSPKEGRA